MNYFQITGNKGKKMKGLWKRKLSLSASVKLVEIQGKMEYQSLAHLGKEPHFIIFFEDDVIMAGASLKQLVYAESRYNPTALDTF